VVATGAGVNPPGAAASADEPAVASVKKRAVSEESEEEAVAVSGTDRLLAGLAFAFSVVSALLSWFAYQAVQP
jgi:hypothetical protein